MLEELNIFWIEEPVKPDNLDGYKFLSENLNCYIAGGEAEFTIYGFKEMFLRNCIQIVQPDVARCGGITGMLKIAHIAESFDIYFAPHTGVSTGICMAASLQISSAVSNFLVYEQMVEENPLVNDIIEPNMPIPDKGYINIPLKAGIGVDIKKKMIDKYTIK
jgi:D-arabinonate dehydratase/D-galactarolactone cycloisomerase